MDNHDLLCVFLKHPLLSESQVERYLSGTGMYIKRRMQTLRRHGWIASVRGTQFSSTVPPLYFVTVAGIKYLAAQFWSAPGEYAKRARYSSAYVAALILRRERVWALREVMLNLFPEHDFGFIPTLQTSQWRMTNWDLEIKLDFTELARSFEFALIKRLSVVPLQGITWLDRGTSEWCLLGFEYDTGYEPIAAVRQRWEQLVETPSYFPPFGSQYAESPLLMILIAANESRAVEYLRLFREISRHKHLRIPEGFFTTTSELVQLQASQHAAIWRDIALSMIEEVSPQPLFLVLKPMAGQTPDVPRLWQRSPHRLDHPFLVPRLQALTPRVHE